MNTPRWYMVNKLGMATLCSDKDDAEKEAADAQMAWPHMGPHRAVQLVEAADVDRALRATQPAVVMLGEQAELRRLSDCCPELNLSNYGPDDVDELNGWAIEVSQCIDRALAAQPAPAAVAEAVDLRARCEEILAWRKTGVLPGETLRTLARENYGDEYDAIQRAERDTETEALNFVIAAPTTQPAPQQEAQEPCPSCRNSDIYACTCTFPTSRNAEPQPSPAAQWDALDTMRLDWLDADESRCVFHLGKSWYTRPSYGLPYRKRASLREAIDAAIDAARTAQEGKSHD